MSAHVQVDPSQIADFCRRHHIRTLSLFDSVLRDDFKPESDVDVLLEFAPEARLGFEIFAMEEELSRLLGGRKVDLVQEQYLIDVCGTASWPAPRCSMQKDDLEP